MDEVEEQEVKKPDYLIQMPGVVTRKTTQPGFVSIGEQDLLQAEAEQQGWFQTVSDSFTSGDNILYQTIGAVGRKLEAGPRDENWAGDTVDEWIKVRGIDPYDEWRYKGTRNQQEAEMLLATQIHNQDVQARLARRGGFSTFAAQAVAGFIDLDAPLAVLTGGLSAAAKTGYNMTKVGRLMAGSAAGALTLGAAGTVSHAVNPAEDWTVIPSMMLMGAGFGALGGALARGGDALRKQGNDALTGMKNDFGEYVEQGTPFARRDSTAQQEAPVDPDPMGVRAAETAPSAPAREPIAIDPAQVQQGPSSAGAAQVGGRPTIDDIPHDASKEIIRKSRQYDVQYRVSEQLEDLHHRTDYAGKAASKFQQLLEKMPFASDFLRLTRSESSVLRTLAHLTMDSGASLLSNNNSAARHFEDMHNRALTHISNIPDKINAYIASKHGSSKLEQVLRDDLRREVNRAVDAEMAARFHTGKSVSGVDPIIKSIADDLDAMYGYMAKIESGDGGRWAATKGSENLKPTSGYMHTKWGAQAYRDVLKKGYSHKDVIDALYEGIAREHPKIKPSDVRIYASAIADRMKLGSVDSGTGIQSWINMDGREAVEAALMRNGMDRKTVNSFLDGMTSAREQKSTPGYTKQRLDIDRSYTASNGIRIGDLMEGDFYGIAVRRAHQGSGRAALARVGITSRTDFENIARAAVYEQEYLIAPTKAKTTSTPTGNKQADSAQKIADVVSDWWNNPQAVKYDDIMEMYNYFNGTPVKGGTHPIISMMKKVSNLTTLGQLGFAQAAEFGTITATMGVKKFLKELPSYIKRSINDPGSGLYQDLRALGVYTPDDRLHRFDQVYATESMASDAHAMTKFNNLLNVGGRVQGFLSGFIHVSRVHHAMSVDAGVNKIFQHYNGVKQMSDRRLRAILGEENTLGPRLKDYIDRGIVEFEDGYVKNLHLDQWAVDDVDAFARALNAYSHQTMQRPLIGESSIATQGNLGTLFWHLKTFPLQAMEKQALRNANIADMESLYTFFHTLGTAALAYTVKQGLNLRGDNLDHYSIATGALGMSNMAGWVPMWTDPIGGMLGMDTGYGRSQSILATPVAIHTLNTMLGIPGVFLKDELTPSDVNILQATPIVGRLLGVTAIANTWKENIRDNRAQARRQAAQDQRSLQDQVDEQVQSGLGM